MNLKEWAKKLNGCEYGNEVSDEDIELLEKDGVVAVFGYSDDNMELVGAINDEYPAYDNSVYYYCGDESFMEENDINEFLDYVDDEYPALKKIVTKALCDNKDNSSITIKKSDKCQFEYETNIPNVEYFDVLEDGELYCKGFIFNINDLV